MFYMTRLLAVPFLTASALHAQNGFFGNWLDRSDQAKADQPSWMTGGEGKL